MTAFCFVHAADLRLDRPWQGIGRTSPRVAEALTSAAVDAWDSLVRLTVDRQAACLLLAGGIGYGTPYVHVRQRLAEGLRQLANQRIPVFGLQDEDVQDGDWLSALVEAGGGRIFHPNSEPAAVVVNGMRVATVYGTRPPAAPAPGVGRHPLHLANQGLRIGLKYLPGRHATDGYQAGESPESLTEYGVDYWALGGQPGYQCISNMQPWIVYSGALQGRSIETEGDGQKGAMVVDCRDGIVEQATFYPLDRIRAVRIQVNAAGLADREALWQALMRQGHSLRLQHEGRSIVVAVSIVNASRSQTWLQESELEELLDRLRRATDRSTDQVQATDPFLWWDSLRPEVTSTGQDERPIEGAFGSALARAVEQVRSDPDRLTAAVRGGASQMDERLRALGFDGGDPAALLVQAEQLVARFLNDEGAEQ
jgi:hypothetical protein